MRNGIPTLKQFRVQSYNTQSKQVPIQQTFLGSLVTTVQMMKRTRYAKRVRHAMALAWMNWFLTTLQRCPLTLVRMVVRLPGMREVSLQVTECLFVHQIPKKETSLFPSPANRGRIEAASRPHRGRIEAASRGRIEVEPRCGSQGVVV